MYAIKRFFSTGYTFYVLAVKCQDRKYSFAEVFFSSFQFSTFFGSEFVSNCLVLSLQRLSRNQNTEHLFHFYQDKVIQYIYFLYSHTVYAESETKIKQFEKQ